MRHSGRSPECEPGICGGSRSSDSKRAGLQANHDRNETR